MAQPSIPTEQRLDRASMIELDARHLMPHQAKLNPEAHIRVDVEPRQIGETRQVRAVRHKAAEGSIINRTDFNRRTALHIAVTFTYDRNYGESSEAAGSITGSNAGTLFGRQRKPPAIKRLYPDRQLEEIRKKRRETCRISREVAEHPGIMQHRMFGDLGSPQQMIGAEPDQ